MSSKHNLNTPQGEGEWNRGSEGERLALRDAANILITVEAVSASPTIYLAFARALGPSRVSQGEQGFKDEVRRAVEGGEDFEG